MRITGVFPDVSSPSGSFLYAFLKGLARMLPADTQAIEGINSLIKLMGRRAPNMSLELMSSRLAIRRALSEDHSMTRKKMVGYQEHRGRFNAINCWLQDCIAGDSSE